MDIRQEIETQGYVHLKNFTLADPNGDLERTMAAVANPIAYLGLPMVMDIKPQPGYQPASFAGTGEFDLHTDLSWYENPPKYIGMFCVSNESAHGGIPLLADGWQALADLSQSDAAYLRQEPVTFPPPDHIDYPPLTGPIAAEQEGKTLIRFRFDMLVDPAPPVRHFFQAVNRHIIHLDVKPGSIFIFDNHRMLHGRTALKAGLGSDRFFKRIYGEVAAG
jgi:alpha-ketoglutarate-dependent taurine dioxygenase